jgi:hypothetical protein
LDYFNTITSLEHRPLHLENLFFQLYECKPKNFKNTFFGLNLQWPTFNLPVGYQQYFLSFHTEYLNLNWIVKQANRVYPKQVVLVTDYQITAWPDWPDNIKTVEWITTHKQIALLQQTVGVANQITVPRYKISSLSYRISQYKKFVTAYLLENLDKDDMIVTYHAELGKNDDLHGHPEGYSYLDQLNTNISKTVINFDDNFAGNSPVANGNWSIPAYTNALINLTNESFHYSKTTVNNYSCCWPGPYLTEKTFKPLLAGRPFLAIGQYQTYSWLKTLGFNVEFGFDTSYDDDPGDLTRIGKIFKVLDFINQNSIQSLFESSLDAVKYNSKWISTGGLYDTCQSINQSNKYEFSIF